ncbi:MAG: SAM-dependent methyltransferase [Sphingobacteriales bacterium]|jgi:16S rRNA (cytidine1402-2'-O)-methyltransferase
MNNKLFLIPCPITEEGLHTLSPEIADAVKQCEVFFVENERSARRFLKKLWKEMVIDDYSWFVIQDEGAAAQFRAQAMAGKNIGIISDAGCPGVADPGQDLIAVAQDIQLTIHPLVGPSSILLALMASGLNGQQFQFHGYLPIQEQDRQKALKKLEADAVKSGTTHIFIETPYRNNALIQTIIRALDPNTRLCIAVDITGTEESIRTKDIATWKREEVNIHKKTAIFLIGK